MPRHAKFPVTIQAHVTVPKKIGNVSFFIWDGIIRLDVFYSLVVYDIYRFPKIEKTKIIYFYFCRI